MMETYRTAPPKTINNSMVVMIKDYLKQTEFDFEKHTEQKISLPKSDVLQFFLKDGSKISVRPSGTEPKIKFYFSVREDFKDVKKFDEMNAFSTKGLMALLRIWDFKPEIYESFGYLI